jgi:hypothetical protein
MLQESLKHVNWLNLLRVIDSLAAGENWGRYDNSKWRPSYKQADLDLPWLLDNWPKVCEALQVLKDNPTEDGQHATRSDGS